MSQEESRAPRLISPRQLAQEHSLNYEAIRRAVRDGVIPSIRLGKRNQLVRADALSLPAVEVKL